MIVPVVSQWSGPKLGWHKDVVNPHLQKYSNLLLGDVGEDAGTRCESNLRIFVPLSGKSVDLAYLAEHPKISHVVGIDIVRQAAVDFALEHPQFSMEEVNAFKECAAVENGDGRDQDCKENAAVSVSTISSFHGKTLTILIRDLFDFLSMEGTDRAKYLTGGFASPAPTEYLFDRIYDRASMVAIQPSQREEYVKLMGELLSPGGAILLVTLDRRKATTDEAKMDGPPFSIDEIEIRKLYESQPWVESVTLLEEVSDLTSDSDRERWAKKGVLELYEVVLLIKKKE